MNQTQHRQFILLSGEADWCRSQAQVLLPGKQVAWISSEAPLEAKALTARQAINLLGGELDALVFDAHSGFDPDVFGAVSGVLKGGGVLVLLTPELSTWADLPELDGDLLQLHGYASAHLKHRFIRRLSHLLNSAPGLVHVRQGESSPVIVTEPVPGASSVNIQEQEMAVDAVIKVATGHRRRPLVLTADRGRGKSAAFGMAAAELLRQGKRRVLVTAPRQQAVNALFQHAAVALPGYEHSSGLIELGHQRIEFIAPDALILNPQTADLLLVDEAAGIPASLLQKLLNRYARIAFATTVHGYEGTGRGFAVRFNRVLNQLTPQWKSLQLHQPIRWAVDDPLEKFTFNALLLDAAPATDEALAKIDVGNVIIECLSRDELIGDESLLRQLFGLLVIAHYRTKPADLRYLLDGPNVSVWIARHQGVVVGAALMAKEGGFDTELSESVWLGKRRPHGHLLPQTLSAKMGLRGAAELHYQRIIRIAVHPAVQQQGWGKKMLRYLVIESRQQGVDFIGSSFGATRELLEFWYKTGFQPVRLGMRREASSGAHSALLLKPLSAHAGAVANTAQRHFMNQFPVLLAQPLRELEASVGLSLMASDIQGELADELLQELSIFAQAGRDYADCLYALRGFALYHCRAGRLPELDRKLLLIKVLQGRDWQTTANLMGLSGRKQVIQQLRKVVKMELNQ